MKLIIAPEYYDNIDSNLPSVFLGGGITNVKLWQDVLIKEIQDLDCIVYNPRRKSFDIKDPTQSEIQIRWEHKYLNESDIVIFYFSSETLCPITLFELGARLMANQNAVYPRSIYIYCEPDYQRKFDVEFQTKLAQENYIDIQEAIYQIYKDNPDYAHLPVKLAKMKQDGPQEYGYDVRCFDNYDRFVLTLSDRIRKGK
jgi:hypothetical protein